VENDILAILKIAWPPDKKFALHIIQRLKEKKAQK
jgi:hypothetical protein